jgi:hypothetical protein
MSPLVTWGPSLREGWFVFWGVGSYYGDMLSEVGIVSALVRSFSNLDGKIQHGLNVRQRI